LEGKFGPLGGEKRIEKLASFEMKNFQKTIRVHTFLNHKRNEEILEELKVEAVDKKLRRYKSKWLRHVTIINNNRMAKIMLDCGPNRRRRHGNPWKRL